MNEWNKVYNYKEFITFIALITECSDRKEHGGEIENYLEQLGKFLVRGAISVTKLLRKQK